MNPADLMIDAPEGCLGLAAGRPGPKVTTVGGPQAALAAEVLAPAAGSDGPGALNTDPDPHAPWVAFVASPARTLAEAAEAGEDLREARDRWIRAAQALLAHLQTDPTSCLLLAAEEVLDAPQAATQYLRGRLGGSTGSLPDFSPPPLPAPAALPLARLTVAHDALLQQLWEELSACCRPLSSAEPELDPLPSFDQLAGMLGQQVAARRDLAQQSQQQQRLEAAHRALQEELELTRLQQRQAHEELEQTLTRLDASNARLEQTTTAHASEAAREARARRDLEESLHRARAEIEQARTDRQALAERHAGEVEELHRRLLAARGQGEEQARVADGLRREADTLQARLADSEQQRLEILRQLRQAQQQSQERNGQIEALQTRSEGLAQALTATQAQLDACRVDAQRLLEEAAEWSQRLQASRSAIELHERRDEALVQEVNALRTRLTEGEAELAEARQKWRLAEQAAQERGAQLEEANLRSERLADQLDAALAGLESASTAGPADAATAVQLTGIELLDVRDEGPHRELSFSLQGWLCPTGTLDDVGVRLVEHQGHPGLVFFPAADGRPALTQWQPTGTENGRPFMILLPADRRPDAPLMQMAPADWRSVVGLATLLARELRTDEGAHLHPHWRDISARLCLELAALPPRLRYAALRSTVTDQGLDIHLEDLVFGTRSWERWRLEWRAARRAGAGGALVWCLPEGTTAPLASWPCQEDGRYCAEHLLPLGPGIDTSTTRTWLEGLPGLDRDLLTALFDTLPAVAAQPDVPARIGAAILALQRDARTAGRSLRVRGVARRVLGRITARS